MFKGILKQIKETARAMSSRRAVGTALLMGTMAAATFMAGGCAVNPNSRSFQQGYNLSKSRAAFTPEQRKEIFERRMQEYQKMREAMRRGEYYAPDYDTSYMPINPYADPRLNPYGYPDYNPYRDNPYGADPRFDPRLNGDGPYYDRRYDPRYAPR